MVVASSGGMGSRLVWAAVAVVTLTVAVLVLRAPAPAPEPPAAERAERVTVSAADWRQVPVPPGGDARRTFVDGDAVHTADGLLGTRRLVRDGDTLSTVDRDVTLSTAGHPATGPFVVTEDALVLQDGPRCLQIVDPATLVERRRHCAQENAEISLLSDETDGAQWRETAPGEPCAAWYRLGAGLVPQRLAVGEPACRSALLVRADGWELTAEFPPYQMGVAHPGPLLAHRDGREITLDSSAVDVQACGSDVYWLSGAGRGTLVRWRPGDVRVEVTELVEPTSLRCVEGALNAIAPTGVWLLKQR